MSVDMTTQVIAVGDNWIKVGNAYIGDQPSAPSAGGIITGTGFGTKNGTPYFDDFESRALGATGGTLGDLTISASTGTSIVNTDSVSGSKALSQDYSAESFPKIYKALSGTQSRFYMSCYIKWSGTVTGSTVWKFGRIGAGTPYSGNPKAGESYTSSNVNYPTNFGGEIVSSNGIVGFGANLSTAGTPSALYTPDTWHFYELEFYAGTVDGNDSYFVVKVDGNIAAEWTGIEFLTTANSALPDWFMTPINGLDNGPSITMLMDSVYLDESRARVVMTDNATYASSTKYAVQPITAYSDTSVTYTKNKGSFVAGSTAYLHLFNDVGTLVYTSGPITVEGSNTSLPAANYVDTGMTMGLVSPRPEAASWSYSKNAYTGVAWNVPIGVRGGAWPYSYTITSNGGATGVSIGEFLDSAVDGATGKTVYTVGDAYGLLSWATPVAGSYTITVRVTDQTGATLDVTVSLTVGTSGWLFVDPVGGNDTTGDGTIGNPFASLVPLHNDSSATTTYANTRIYLRAGTTPLGGMATDSGKYRIEQGKVPCEYIGYPSEAAILEWDGGWVSSSSVDDLMFKDLECRYKSTYLPSGTAIFMFIIDTGGDRITLINNTFTNFDGSPVNVGSGNSSIIYTTGPAKNHMFVSRCSQTNQTGTFTSCYNIVDSLFEYHRVHNATTGTHDGSARRFIYLKDSPVRVTVRGCNMWENITWDSGDLDNYGCIGIGGQDGAQDVEFCYNYLAHPGNPATARAGAIYNYGLNAVSHLIENIYVYRNSLDRGIEWEGVNHTNMADNTEVHQKNINSGGAEVVSAKVSNIDNLSGSVILDSNLKLTGASRTASLGTHGAEVAQ